MRAIASDRRPRKVADERSRSARSAVASYGFGVCLGLVACIITILLFELTGPSRDTIPEPELRLAYAQAPPSVPPAEVSKLSLAAGEYTSTGIDRSTNQKTRRRDRRFPSSMCRLRTRQSHRSLNQLSREVSLRRRSSAPVS